MFGLNTIAVRYTQAKPILRRVPLPHFYTLVLWDSLVLSTRPFVICYIHLSWISGFVFMLIFECDIHKVITFNAQYLISSHQANLKII